MGVTINIIDSWEVFKAAKTAVSNTIQMVEISRLASSRAEDLQVNCFWKIKTKHVKFGILLIKSICFK